VLPPEAPPAGNAPPSGPGPAAHARARGGGTSTLTRRPAVIAGSVVGFYGSVGMANNYTDFRVSMIAARRLFAMMDQAPAVEDRARGA